MIRYVFKDNEMLPILGAKHANPQVIGEALEAIRQKHGGSLEPSAVVDAARSSRHPLHRHFQWDDKKAAEAFRIEQARAIIRVVRVADAEAEDGDRRAFVAVPASVGGGYRTSQQVRESVDLQAAVLAAADRELAAFQRRFREMRDLCADIDAVREKIARRRIAGAAEATA